MGLSAKLVRSQLNFFKPFVASCSLEVTRKGQDKLGELMEVIHRHNVIVKDHPFEGFEGAWIIPKEERRSGVVLYLHGGGACGDYIAQAVALGCDTFVTSDLRYHDFLDTKELNLIDAGHFPTEQVIVPELCRRLQAAFPAASVSTSTSHRCEVIQYCI